MHPTGMHSCCIFFQLSWALIEITGLSSVLAFGLLANGSCPSGGNSNIFTMLLNGDITLSLCMTFASNVVALGRFFEKKNL